MATYIIGDVQGCYQELQCLLQCIDYQPSKDHLAFVGDLVSRGPDSLSVLRFVRQQPKVTVVLGNHDLYLLLLGYNLADAKTIDAKHTLHNILTAPDKWSLLTWLRKQPLIAYNDEQHYAIVHAGIPPQWTLREAIALAQEVQQQLQNEQQYLQCLSDLFGNVPNTWNNALQGADRHRYIVNALTRMRFCDARGALDLSTSSITHHAPKQFKPWFDWRALGDTIFFGHWAALGGQCAMPGYYALDTGCVWGHRLTAIRVEDRRYFSVPAQNTYANLTNRHF